MKFKIDKNVSEFRNHDDFLHHVYEENKEFFDNFPWHEINGSDEITSRGMTETMFKGQVKATQIIWKKKYGKDLNIKQAVQQLGRRVGYEDIRDRSKRNFIKGLTERADGSYQQFRELTKDEHGRYTKVDYDKLVYDNELKAYTYDNKFYIDISNSPVMVTFIKL